MFGSDNLDVGIGVVFFFLMLSLVCSAISELLESVLKNRPKDLETGLRQLLMDPDGTLLVKRIYDHALINGLFRGSYSPTARQRLPSYIPSRTFALALMDILRPATGNVPSGAAGATATQLLSGVGAATDAPSPLKELRDAVAVFPNPEAKTAMLALIDAAGNDATKARENIEDWYNAAMDRVSGWYKRRTQFILFALGILLGTLSNADAIGFTKYLSTNKDARNLIVSKASVMRALEASPIPGASDSNGAPTPPQLVDSLAWLQREAGLPLGWRNAPVEPVKPTPLPSPGPGATAGTYDARLAAYKDSEASYVAERREFGQDWRRVPQGWEEWLLKILGIVLTGCAVSFGAPFWFDVLNKFMIVRSTVKPQEKSQEQASKS